MIGGRGGGGGRVPYGPRMKPAVKSGGASPSDPSQPSKDPSSSDLDLRDRNHGARSKPDICSAASPSGTKRTKQPSTKFTLSALADLIAWTSIAVSGTFAK